MRVLLSPGPACLLLDIEMYVGNIPTNYSTIRFNLSELTLNIIPKDLIFLIIFLHTPQLR